MLCRESLASRTQAMPAKRLKKISIRRNLFLRIAEEIAKMAKLEPTEISCHTVDYFRVGLCILVFNKVYPVMSRNKCKCRSSCHGF